MILNAVHDQRKDGVSVKNISDIARKLGFDMSQNKIEKMLYELSKKQDIVISDIDTNSPSQRPEQSPKATKLYVPHDFRNEKKTALDKNASKGGEKDIYAYDDYKNKAINEERQAEINYSRDSKSDDADKTKADHDQSKGKELDV